MLLGTQLWYGFFGSTLRSEAAFGKRISELCRALGRPERANQPVGGSAENNGSVHASVSESACAENRTMLKRAPPPSTPVSNVVDGALQYPPQFGTSTPVSRGSDEIAGVGGGGESRYHHVYPARSPSHAPATPALHQTSHSFATHPEVGQLLSHARENMVRLEERQNQSIAKLEERQNQSFIEELTAAKKVARLEAELRAKEREVGRLEAELIRSGHARETMFGTVVAVGVGVVLAVMFASKRH
jgi:hypothetical protein